MNTTPAHLADGLLVRIGSREGVQAKARRYLLDGRVMVRYVGPEGVRAFVRGQGELYRVDYTPGRSWSCTCAARGRCCHIVGVQLVTIAPSDPRVPPEGYEA